MFDQSDLNKKLLASLVERNIENFATLLSQAMQAPEFNINRKVQHGRTLLSIACRHGATDCVRLLLEKGSDPNIVNDTGTSPLMYAKTAVFASGNLNLLDLLLSYGAELHHTDKHGKDAAQYTKERAGLILSYFESRGLVVKTDR
jgi:ankyrin repeat protein